MIETNVSKTTKPRAWCSTYTFEGAGQVGGMRRGIGFLTQIIWRVAASIFSRSLTFKIDDRSRGCRPILYERFGRGA